MRNYRLPKTLAAASLAVSLLMTPASAAFTDTQGHWAEGAIGKWSEEYQLIQGYDDGTFRPDQSITRGAFAGILDRFMRFQKVSPPETFSDSKGDFWEDAILKLHAAGVYLGNEGKALSRDSITRQQAVTMVARAFQIKSEDSPLNYWDADQVAEYARGPIAAMSKLNYITDSADGNFRPQDPITRAELVNLLNNMVQKLIHEGGSYTGQVEGSVMINAAEGAELKDMHIFGDLLIAPGVQGKVTLSHVQVGGEIRSFGAVTPEILEEKEPEKPVPPEEDPLPPHEPSTPETPPAPVVGIQPSEVYQPGVTTGETIAYGGKQIPVYRDAERSRLGEGDFIWSPVRPDRLEYVGRDYLTQFGIDVSAYQNRASENQTIDWNAVAADGVSFAMVRAGLRGTSTGAILEDSFFRQNVRGAMEAGIETGVYFFAQAITVEEAIEEADFVINLLKTERINGPVAYDWEMHDNTYRVYGTSPEMATACAVAFCQRIEQAGYTPMIYAGNYVGYMKYDQGAIERYARWYPEYKSTSSEKLYPTFYYHPDYWQYSSKCKVNGIGGNVDVNLRFIR